MSIPDNKEINMSRTVTNATATASVAAVELTGKISMHAIDAAKKVDQFIDWAKEDAQHPLAQSRVKQGGLAAGLFGAGAVIGALLS